MNINFPIRYLIQALLLSTLLAFTPVWGQTTTPQDSKGEKAKTAKSIGKQPKKTAAKGTLHYGKPSELTKSTPSDDKVSPANRDRVNHDFWFYSVDINLYQDPNHNGYFNRLVVDFDVDTAYDVDQIYAVMSLTDPYGLTTDYYVTSDFHIYGESNDDSFEVDTVLTDNWPANGYDLSISVYDSHNDELVAYVDKYDAPQMSYLPLESLDYEYSAEQYLSVFSADLALFNDNDGDGYYHSFGIDLDVDVNYGGLDAFAEIYISDDGYNWTLLHTSNVFHIQQDSLQDKRHWDFDLVDGYNSDHYFIRVDIIDADSYLTLMEIEPQQQPAFYDIPLESADLEQPAPPQAPNEPRSSVSHESGGNFGGLGVMTALSLLAWFRRHR